MASKPPTSDEPDVADPPDKPDKPGKDHDTDTEAPARDNALNSGEGRANRAAGDDKPAARQAPGGTEEQIFIDAFIDELDQAKIDNHRLTEEDKQAIARLAWERAEDSLTCLGWFGMDDLEYTRDSGSALERASQFVDGLHSLWDRYQDMKTSNTKGGDRYYHCLGHCEAASQGPGGQLASKITGVGRELVDLPKYTARIGLVRATVDGFADTFINREGYRAGTSGVRCYDHCGRFKPRGM